LGAGVEEAALLAAVQLELAFGAFSVGIEAGGEDGAAVGAAGAGYGADHARGARTELIGARAALRGPAIVIVAIVLRFFLVVFFRVSITAVTVLSIHKRLRPSVLDGLQLNQLSLRDEQFRTFGNLFSTEQTFDAGELPNPRGGANEDRRKPVPHCDIARKTGR
jgi:hypothetical protein